MCGVIDLEDDFCQVELEEDVDLNTLPKEHFIKLLVLGDLGVGKTSLLKNYTSVDQRHGAVGGAAVTHGNLDNTNTIGQTNESELERDKSDYK